MRRIPLLLVLIICCACKESPKPILTTTKVVKTDTINVAESIVVLNDSLHFKGITKDFVLGKTNYRTDSTFIKAEPLYASKTLYLKKEAYRSFIKMYNAAKLEGIDLKIISGTRNFYEQKAIWERKWKRYKNLPEKERALKILEYSSMPTTSRHHWGTDIDLNNLNNSYFEKGKGLKEYNWLTKNAQRFGFYQVYTNKSNGRTGYNLEKWHWSYLPLSKTYLEFYIHHMSYKDITGFKGADTSKVLNIITDYVNGVNPEIK